MKQGAISRSKIYRDVTVPYGVVVLDLGTLVEESVAHFGIYGNTQRMN